MDIVWVVVLQLLGSLGIIAEIMVPSFGALTAMSVIAFGGSYYQLYQFNPEFIPFLIIINVFSIPLTLLVSVKLLGKSPLALNSTLEENITKDEICEVGDIGVAMTTLRPAGKIELAGKMVDVISTGDFIEKESTVKVVDIDNTGIKVIEIEPAKAVEENAATEDNATAQEAALAGNESE